MIERLRAIWRARRAARPAPAASSPAPPPPAPAPSPPSPPPADSRTFAERYRAEWQRYWSAHRPPTRDEIDQAQVANDPEQVRRDEDELIRRMVRAGGILWPGEGSGARLGRFRNPPDLSPFGRLVGLDEWAR